MITVQIHSQTLLEYRKPMTQNTSTTAAKSTYNQDIGLLQYVFRRFNAFFFYQDYKLYPEWYQSELWHLRQLVVRAREKKPHDIRRTVSQTLKKHGSKT